MNKILTPIIIAFIWIACKNNSPAKSGQTETKKTDTVSISKADSGKTRLVILFYSTGNGGADANGMKSFETGLRSYSDRIGKNIDYEKNAWGREGETDYCLALNELTSTEQKDFISNTRTELEKAKYVNIYENFPCPQRHHK